MIVDDDDVPQVLVVEDDAFQALWAARALDRAGYEVLGPAADELTALQLIGEEPPDAAIVDIDLSGPYGPGKDGSTRTSAQILSALNDWDVPVLIVTSHDRVELLASVEDRPQRLLKPVSEDSLLNALEELLTGNRAGTSSCSE